MHIYGQNNFYSMILAFDMRRNLDLLCIFFTMARKLPRVRIWRKNIVNSKQSDFILDDRKVAIFMLLSVLFNQHGGAIYLR